MGHSQGYTQRGYMFIHCESRGTWACVSVYWSSALKSWLCLWKIVSMKDEAAHIKSQQSSNVVSWPEEKHICLYVLLWKWSCVIWLCAAMFAGGVSPHIVLSLIPVGSVNTITRKNFTQISNSFLLLLSFLLPLTRLPDLLPPRQQGPSALDYSGGGVQCSAVHCHRTFLWAELRFPTHCSHCRGLGCRTGSCGCYHWTQR